MGGIRIFADQLLHGRDGIFGATEFVVRPRLLIEDLVSVLVIRVLGEDSVIESDCLEWPLGICAPEQSIGWRGIGVAARRDRACGGRAPLEILIGFPSGCTGDQRVRIGPIGLLTHNCVGGLRGVHLPRLGVAYSYSVLLLDLQVGEAPHRLGSHRGLRCLFDNLPILGQSLIEAILDRYVLHVWGHFMQVCQRSARVLLGTRGAANHECQREHHWNGEEERATHHFSPAPACARAARS